jgi:hypothetical protein
MLTTGISRAEERLPRWMLALGALATIVAFVAGQPHFAAGFVLGAGLALVNYFWLHQAVEHLMATGEERLPRLLIAKFLLRYPLVIGGVYLLYRTGWVSVPGLLAGLFVPVGGVLLESFVQIREGLRSP